MEEAIIFSHVLRVQRASFPGATLQKPLLARDSKPLCRQRVQEEVILTHPSPSCHNLSKAFDILSNTHIITGGLVTEHIT